MKRLPARSARRCLSTCAGADAFHLHVSMRVHMALDRLTESHCAATAACVRDETGVQRAARLAGIFNQGGGATSSARCACKHRESLHRGLNSPE